VLNSLFSFTQISSGYGTNVGEFIYVLRVTLLVFSHYPCPPPEGPWSQVSQAIHDCHTAVHARGAPRIATDIRIGTRVDRIVVPGEGNNHKVKRVEDILAQDQQ
jgi:Thiamine-binding protein